MATLEQIKTLDYIKKERLATKKAHKNIAATLCMGQNKYKTAINTMISIGALSIVFAIVGAIISAYDVYDLLSHGYGEYISTYNWLLIAAIFVIYAIEIVLGVKLYRLDATPIFVLVTLIIVLLGNIFLIGGILHWVVAIFAVIGIVCWGTFRNWFNHLSQSKSIRKR